MLRYPHILLMFIKIIYNCSYIKFIFFYKANVVRWTGNSIVEEVGLEPTSNTFKGCDPALDDSSIYQTVRTMTVTIRRPYIDSVV